MNLTIFGMCVVDTWSAWSQKTGIKCTQSAFFSGLTEELIDSTFDTGVGGTGASNPSNNVVSPSSLFDRTTGQPRAGNLASRTRSMLLDRVSSRTALLLKKHYNMQKRSMVPTRLH